MGFRITTWNVNGIRNPFSYEPWRGNRTFESMFDILESDIVVFQETKIQRKDLRDDMVLVPGWDCYFSLPRIKKGECLCNASRRKLTPGRIFWSSEEGLFGLLCPPNSSTPFRDLPEDQQIGGYPTLEQLRRPAIVSEDCDSDDEEDENTTPDGPIDPAILDSEGRSVVLEFPAFVLIGLYCPANRDEKRDPFRLGFLNALDARVRNLVAMGKRVFVTGDINIAKQVIDSAHALEAIRKSTATEEDYISAPSRRLFNQLLSDGKVVGPRDEGREQPVMHDICRSFHPSRAGMYTCWDTRLNTRPGNFGARIDYVLCSLDMKDWFADSNIQEGLMGSDHCPVYAIFKDHVPCDGRMVHIRDIMNPPGAFKDGERQQTYSSQWMLSGSGRLLPEFDVDKRRNIKDMFARKPPPSLSRSPSTASAVEKTTVTLDTESISSPTPTPSDVPKHPPPTSSQSQNSNTLSRKRSQPLPATSTKRSKPATTPSGASASAAGQKTLKGFFKPKPVAGGTSAQPATHSPTSSTRPSYDGTSSSASSIAGPASITSQVGKTSHPLESTADTLLSAAATPSTQSSPSKPQTDTFIDPIVSKEDWSKLFTKKPVPRCDSHQEPCVSLTTKKPGMNRGRAFWICPRPLGPSGAKEKGTQWRCPTFIWASDWNSASQGEGQ
ncbi:Endonuclease/exonuclease/phosphatase [Penicillium canariense]|uniref:DNA-(apurinic or apyrimidinic site) endonuclease 2 n=1 Tax=Penicillium canariense TaxID=189055 RepID=A0A9W9LFQ2_9EURO|nr:Endonuclease/exonuclease/phosphatase [Penicillium canariense]KAJ5152949.1 Endonuclease/exonuclease/phosphatase [Penicillium canariense]